MVSVPCSRLVTPAHSLIIGFSFSDANNLNVSVKVKEDRLSSDSSIRLKTVFFGMKEIGKAETEDREREREGETGRDETK